MTTKLHNSLEKTFADRYFLDLPLSTESSHDYRNKYLAKGIWLVIEFSDFLKSEWEKVTEPELIDFLTRFNYIKIDGGVIYNTTGGNTTLRSYFNRVDKAEQLGRLVMRGERSEACILNEDGKIIAKYVGSLSTYHEYNTCVLFAGIIGEVICQLPPEIKNSDNTFYYSCRMDSEILETHRTILDFYEECH